VTDATTVSIRVVVEEQEGRGEVSASIAPGSKRKNLESPLPHSLDML
jgi:hypothetical protein